MNTIRNQWNRAHNTWVATGGDPYEYHPIPVGAWFPRPAFRRGDTCVARVPTFYTYREGHAPPLQNRPTLYGY